MATDIGSGEWITLMLFLAGGMVFGIASWRYHRRCLRMQSARARTATLTDLRKLITLLQRQRDLPSSVTPHEARSALLQRESLRRHLATFFETLSRRSVLVRNEHWHSVVEHWQRLNNRPSFNPETEKAQYNRLIQGILLSMDVLGGELGIEPQVHEILVALSKVWDVIFPENAAHEDEDATSEVLQKALCCIEGALQQHPRPCAIRLLRELQQMLLTIHEGRSRRLHLDRCSATLDRTVAYLDAHLEPNPIGGGRNMTQVLA